MRCSNKMQTFVCHPLIAMINDGMNPFVHCTCMLYACCTCVKQSKRHWNENFKIFKTLFFYFRFSISFWVLFLCRSLVSKPNNIYFVCIKLKSFPTRIPIRICCQKHNVYIYMEMFITSCTTTPWKCKIFKTVSAIKLKNKWTIKSLQQMNLKFDAFTAIDCSVSISFGKQLLFRNKNTSKFAKMSVNFHKIFKSIKQSIDVVEYLTRFFSVAWMPNIFIIWQIDVVIQLKWTFILL